MTARPSAGKAKPKAKGTSRASRPRTSTGKAKRPARRAFKALVKAAVAQNGPPAKKR